MTPLIDFGDLHDIQEVERIANLVGNTQPIWSGTLKRVAARAHAHIALSETRSIPSANVSPTESPLAWIVFVHADPQGYDYRIFTDEREADNVAGEDERNGEAIPLYRASAFTVSATAATKDAERWQAGRRLGYPEYCPHWEGEPTGDGWYHQHTGEKAFRSPDEAMDAAILAATDRTDAFYCQAGGCATQCSNCEQEHPSSTRSKK